MRITKKALEIFASQVATCKKSGIPGDDSMVYVSDIDGSYMGHTSDPYLLRALLKRGITKEIQASYKGGKTAAIGYNPTEKKWYGWSHRCICGFKRGDMIFDPKFGDDNTPFTKHGKVKIKNLADAKKAAQNFAKYVG